MKNAILNITFIKEDKRLDGSFFLNDHANNSRMVKQHSNKCKPLLMLANVFNPPVFKRQFCKETIKSVPYCQSSDVTNILDGSNVFINKKQAIITNTIVKKNQILITGFGTIGNCRLVNSLSTGNAYANNVCRVEVIDNNLYGFVYAFLSSKYGIGQINKNASGSVVRYIEAPGIKKILIPNLEENLKNEIHNIIIKVSRLREDANVAIKNAQEKFEKYSQVVQMTNKTTIKRISNYQNRLDAQFGLIFQSIKEFIIAKDFTYLGEVTSSIFMGPRSKRNYVSKGVGFLNTSEMMLSNPSNPKKFVSNKTKGFEVHKDWILISRSGTIGNCVIVGDMLKNYFVTEDAIRIVCNKDLIHPNYVFAFLISSIGTKLIQSGAFGSVIQHIDEQLLASIPIPLLSKNEQSEVIDNVQKYRDNYDLAIQLENKAIQLIETEIESWQN